MSVFEPTHPPTCGDGRPGGPVAVAHPNMALVKYWGKRDESLILPVTGSLSMTLDIFPTSTQVTLQPRAAADTVMLNGQNASSHTRSRVERFLDLVREMAGRSERARVQTHNTIPTGAGLASSAAGFAALAAAATTAYGVESDARALSRLARRGSGSACRSIFGDFAIWHAGTGFGAAGDESCYAEPTACTVDAALVIAIVDAGAKALPSRVGMRQSMATSPFYLPWATATRHHLEQVQAALAAGDLVRAGRIAEHNALGMHAVLLASQPSIRYLAPESLRVLDCVEGLRADGIAAYATIDAGPNVAVLCDRSDAQQVVAALGRLDDLVAIHVAHPGPGVTATGGDPR